MTDHGPAENLYCLLTHTSTLYRLNTRNNLLTTPATTTTTITTTTTTTSSTTTTTITTTTTTATATTTTSFCSRLKTHLFNKAYERALVTA